MVCPEVCYQYAFVRYVVLSAGMSPEQGQTPHSLEPSGRKMGTPLRDNDSQRRWTPADGMSR